MAKALTRQWHLLSSEVEHDLCPPDNRRVTGRPRHRRIDVLALRLPILQVNAALLDGSRWGEVLVVVHDRLGVASAREATKLIAGDDRLVAVEIVLVPRLLRAHAEALANIRIYVVEMVVVVAAEVVLHALPSVHQEVVVRVVVARAVIVIHILLRRVVVDEEVVMDLAPRHRHRRRAGAHAREEGLPVPAVEGAVVARLTTRREDEIVRDLVAPAEAIVRVDACARAVEEDVSADARLCRLRLNKEAALLLVQPDLPRCAALDCRVARVVAICAVHAGLRVVLDDLAGPSRIGGGLVGVAPRGDGVPSDEGKV
mmetsp:Transcript_28297/g.59469  ORF Transcript_28297/g.59469 Transcript_28297/m.59469 type:complete len:314 (-) Transcript_28297:1546-2487(-)